MAHRMLLANTSHELRTPLARIRLGIELLQVAPDAKRKADLEKDIAELDALIEQILLSSRLEAVRCLDSSEDVDLLAVAAEEAARYEQCSVSGDVRTGARRPRSAAADGAQSARQRAAARRCANQRGRQPRWCAGGNAGLGPW